MNRFLRLAYLVGIVVVIALSGSSSVRADEPSAAPSTDTLGATVQNVVYMSDAIHTIQFKNRSTVPATFDFSSASWSVTPAQVTLAPDASGSVTVAGNGADKTKVDVTMTSAGAVPEGTSRTALAFSATIYHDRPFDATPILRDALIAILALLVLARVAFVARRFVRTHRLVKVG